MKGKKRDYMMSMKAGGGSEVRIDPDVLEEGAAHGLNRIEQWKILEQIARDRHDIREQKAAAAAEFNDQLKRLDDLEDDVLAALDERNSQLTMPLEEKAADGE